MWAPILALTTALAAAQPAALSLAEKDLSAFGQPVAIKVLGLAPEAAARALSEAELALARTEALFDPEGKSAGSVGRLNAAAGGGPQPVDPAVLDALARTLGFCSWSDGSSSPLAGELYRLWGLRTPAAALPIPADLAAAAESAACDRLRLDPAKGTAELAAGSRVDLWSYSLGLAVDAAVEALKGAGAENGFVAVGTVVRAFGEGADGRGWLAEPPAVAGLDRPLPSIWLVDRALAAASREDAAIGAGGETYPPYLDMRSGKPAAGCLAVLAATELATEAQGLAAAMFATGSRAGQLRLGRLQPRPAVLWVLGSGEGHPLVVEYHWGELPKAGGARN